MWVSSKPHESLRYCIGSKSLGTPQLAVVEISSRCKPIDFSAITRDKLRTILEEPPEELLDEISEMDWSHEDNEDHRDWINRASLYVILQKF